MNMFLSFFSFPLISPSSRKNNSRIYMLLQAAVNPSRREMQTKQLKKACQSWRGAITTPVFFSSFCVQCNFIARCTTTREPASVVQKSIHEGVESPSRKTFKKTFNLVSSLFRQKWVRAYLFPGRSSAARIFPFMNLIKSSSEPIRRFQPARLFHDICERYDEVAELFLSCGLIFVFGELLLSRFHNNEKLCQQLAIVSLHHGLVSNIW